MLQQFMSTTLSQLRKDIDTAARAYYGDGTSTVSDQQYDSLIGLLRQLCPEDPRLSAVGPLYTDRELKNKFSHRIPMGSLDNTEGGIAGFSPWYLRACNDLVEPLELCLSHKVDGNSAAAYYEKGELVRVLTRGDGLVGDDITSNAVYWPGLPTSLPVPVTISIRGEAVLPKAAFDTLNTDGQYNNPRNLCAGIINRKSDPELNANIEFHVFNTDAQLPTLSQRLENAEELGFKTVWHKVVRYRQLSTSVDIINAVVKCVQEYFNALEDASLGGLGGRAGLPYEIDGLVVAIDDIQQQERLIDDENDRLRPKHSRAIKFVTLKAQTRVVGCQITMGHTGALIPTADLAPTPIGGVTVDSALLNNWNADSSFPSAAHIAVGDLVEIERAGDVIPKITRVIDPVYRHPINLFIGTISEISERYGDVQFDQNDGCPSGAEHCEDKRWPYLTVQISKSVSVPLKLEFTDNRIYLERPTIAEPQEWEGKPTTRIRRGKLMASTYVELDSDHASIRKQKIKHWINKIGILGIGDGVLDALVAGEEPLVSNPDCLYRLGEEQLSELRIGSNGSRLGVSKARALLKQITANKTVPLAKFLGGLGVELLGSRRADIIAREQNLTSLDDWLDEEKLQKIPGNIIRESIISGLREVRPVIALLLDAGVVVEPIEAVVPKQDQNGLNLTGYSFCFTGIRLPEAEVQIVAAGGTIKTGVSKNLTHLVQKDPTSRSTKTQKADELGVKVISVATLEAVLAGQKTLS